MRRCPTLIANKEGVGAELAMGVRALCEKYGVPELSMEVKNLEMPGYDPRGSFGMSVGYATSDRGGCHMRTYSVGDEILAGTMPNDTMDGKVEQILAGNTANGFIGQNFSSIKFCGIWCDFWAVTPEQLARCLQAPLQARGQRGRGHADGRARLEPRPALQPARGRRDG